MVTDRPRTLATEAERTRRTALLGEPHMAPLTALVNEFHRERGTTRAIPHFDPLDGGIEARVLFVLEAPGRKAVDSGFISRNNDDNSAATFFAACDLVTLPRNAMVVWNIVPWRLTKPDGTNRNPTRSEIEDGKPFLARVLALLPRLQVIVLVGGAAQRLQSWITGLRPAAAILHAPHPSPSFVNRSPANRERLEDAFRRVGELLREREALGHP